MYLFSAITHSFSQTLSQCIPHSKQGGQELYSSVSGRGLVITQSNGRMINNYLLAVEVNERLQ